MESLDRRRERRQRRTLKRLRAVRTGVGLLAAALALFLAVRLGASLFSSGKADAAGTGSAGASVSGQAVQAGGGEAPQDGDPQAGKAAEAAAATKLEALREKFPDGKYWNHMSLEKSPGPDSVTDLPCDHAAYGEAYCNSYNGATSELFPQYEDPCQCLGFASMLSDLVFGESAPVSIHRSWEQLRVGDQIRLTSEEHSMVVIEKSGDWVRVAECNADYQTCRIGWGRELSRQQLEDYGEELEYITRYEK